MIRLLSVLIIVSAFACGRGGPPLTTDPAQMAVEASLASWLKGGTPQQSGHKGVEMSDPDWKAGYELTNFKVNKIEGDKVHVALELQDAKGKPVQKKVVYAVKPGEKTMITRGPAAK